MTMSIKPVTIIVFFITFSCMYLYGQQKSNTDSLKLIINTTEVDSIKYKAISDLYYSYKNINLDSALTYALKRHEISIVMNDSLKIADAINGIGVVYWKKENYIEAYKYFQQALQLFSSIKSELGIAHSINNIGNILFQQGNYDRATTNYIKALSIFENLNAEQYIAIISNNLGIIFAEQKDYKKAKEYLKKALSLYDKLDYFSGLIGTYQNLGLIYQDQKDIDSAIIIYKKALDISKKNGLKVFEAKIYNSLADFYTEKGDYNKSLELLKKALIIYKETGYSKDNLTSFFSLGDIYLKRGNTYEAINYYQNCLKVAQKQGSKAFIQKSSRKLAYAYSVIGKHKKANKYFKIAYEYRDSIYNEDSRLKINQIEMRHNFNKQLQEVKIKQEQNNKENKAKIEVQKLFKNFAIGIAVLFLLLLIVLSYNYKLKKSINKKMLAKNNEILSQSKEIHKNNEVLHEKNREILEQKKKIEELNHSKDKLFSIIGHDLKNIIGTEASSLSLFASGEIDIDSEKSKLMLFELRDNSKRAYQLLENLLLWGKSQLSGVKLDPKNFDLSDLINNTVGFLTSFANKKNININILLPKDSQIYADEESIRFVIRNLLSNAIKFSNQESEVNINVIEENGKIKITIKDSGVGISEEQLAAIKDKTIFYTTRGTSLEHGNGMGLMLCFEYLDANGASLEIMSEIGKGSEFSFLLPRAKI
ncbi:MAG: tetratricopeptide repeat protein [Bacteroidota bacterium]